MILSCATLFQPLTIFAAESPTQTEDSVVEQEQENIGMEDVVTFEVDMDHPMVEQFKKDLQMLGFGTDWETITTTYDEEMKDVVEQFQTYYEIPVSGQLAVEDQEMIETLITESLQIEDEDAEIVTFKEQLYSVMNVEVPSPMTEVFDEEMEALVLDFQEKYELVVNGLLDLVTVEKLADIYEELQATDETEEESEEETSTEEESEEVTEENEESTETTETIEVEEVVTEEKSEEVAEENAQESIAPVMARMAATPVATSVTYYAEGMRSADVKKMKQNLVKIGFGTHWKNPTTLFGKDTVEVVKEFQRYYGLSADGSMGPASLNKLDEVLTSPYQKGKRSSAIKTVKNKLKSIGYGTHWKNPTTLYGADTVKVVKDFQKKQNLVVNGIIDSKTLSKIDSLYNNKGSGAYTEGMRSADIKKMKQNLKKIGFGTHWKNPTTLYGSDTVKVVKEFQRYYGLSSDGSFGPSSKNKLNEVLNSPYQKGKRSSAIKKVKNNLKFLGYANHWKNPTTLYGADTVKVVKDFQKKQNLVVNGIIDPVTLNKINSLVGTTGSGGGSNGKTVKIFIDAGHGGSDPGASGNGLKEKDLTLDISKRIQTHLNKYNGVEIKMARTSDQTLSLKQRTDMANSWKADFFFSVHINSFTGSSANGFESFVYNNRPTLDEVNKQKTIHDHFMNQNPGNDRGKKQANFHVLRESNMTAMLAEYYFITNPNDAKLLKSSAAKDKMAKATADGIAKAYGLKRK